MTVLTSSCIRRYVECPEGLVGLLKPSLILNLDEHTNNFKARGIHQCARLSGGCLFHRVLPPKLRDYQAARARTPVSLSLTFTFCGALPSNQSRSSYSVQVDPSSPPSTNMARFLPAQDIESVSGVLSMLDGGGDGYCPRVL